MPRASSSGSTIVVEPANGRHDQHDGHINEDRGTDHRPASSRRIIKSSRASAFQAVCAACRSLLFASRSSPTASFHQVPKHRVRCIAARRPGRRAIRYPQYSSAPNVATSPTSCSARAMVMKTRPRRGLPASSLVPGGCPADERREKNTRFRPSVPLRRPPSKADARRECCAVLPSRPGQPPADFRISPVPLDFE